MNFEQRASRARQSGEAVRAAVLLIEGLKRHPAEQSALELLCEIYVEDLDSSGLEYDLTRIILAQRDPGVYFDGLLGELSARQKKTMGRELIRVARDEGYNLSWPPPRVEAPPEPEPPSAPETLAETPQGISLEVAESESEAESPDSAGSDGVSPDISWHNMSPLSEDAREATGVIEEEPLQDKDADGPDNEPVARSKPAPAPPTVLGERAKKKMPKSASPRRFRRVLFLSILIIGVGASVFWWWNSAPTLRGAGSMDSAIEVSDPALSASAREIFGDAAAKSESKDIRERRAFVAAVYAADWGAESSATSTRETVWGLASTATSWALRGDFERALSESARLERQHPGALATYWARGFVAESRGQFADALSHYLAGQKRYPKFAPFLSAQLRIALRQARAEQATELQSELAALSPDNPYNHLKIALPDLADFDGRALDDAETLKSGVLPVERPRFVLAMQHLEHALVATRKGDWRRAREAAEASLQADPALGPALLVAGVLRAGDLDVRRADAAWARLAQTPGMSAEYRWIVQIAAPQSLAAAGRPDLGYKYAVQVKALGKVDPRELRDLEKAFEGSTSEGSKMGAPSAKDPKNTQPIKLPESLMPLLSVEAHLHDEPLAQQAILARAELLSHLGLTRAAAESLELLDGVPKAQQMRAYLRVKIAIRDGQIRQARALAASLKDSPESDGARAEIAFYSGNYKSAISQATRALEHSKSIELRRALVLSQLALGHGRLARSLLDAAPVPPLQRGAFRALKMRVERGGLARDAESQRAENTVIEKFLEMNPTSVERLVDLANLFFWQTEFTQARAFAEQALRLAEADPAAHWVMGLVEHISGQESAADRHFRAAWRKDPSDPLLLVEMGRIYMDMGEPKRAQRAFYRALLRDRTSTSAIQGLGRAYLASSRATGVRDLSRILAGYKGASKYLAQSVEALRWLAILSGARDGKEAGYEYLQTAVSLIGESADLLLELAQYHAARGDTEQARKLFARVLEKDSTRAEARIGVARMAIKAGDEVNAAAQLRRYLRFDPVAQDAQDTEWARETLAKLEGDGNKKDGDLKKSQAANEDAKTSK